MAKINWDLNTISLLICFIAAINIGLASLLNFNIVETLSFGQDILRNTIFPAVFGLSGVYQLYDRFIA